MAKRDLEKDEVVEVVDVVTPPTPVFVEKKAQKLLTFEQWASRVGIKKQHLGGLKAFVPGVQRSRTFEEWNKAVEGY